MKCNIYEMQYVWNVICLDDSENGKAIDFKQILVGFNDDLISV